MARTITINFIALLRARRWRTPKHYRHGYVLAMTLILLAIAAAVVTVICLRSLDRAVQAVTAQEELQRRWGQISCQSTLLPRAEEILNAQRQSPPGENLPKVQLSFTLGRQAVRLIIADEQAKVNVNTLLARNGIEDGTRSIRALLPDHDASGQVKLQPQVRSASGSAIETFESIFPTAGPGYLTGQAPWHEPATADLTCWGSGQVNFRRASRSALEVACAPLLGGAGSDRILSLRRQFPGATSEEMVKMLELTDDQRQQLIGRLTGDSACHSLWFIAEAKERSWYWFSVATASGLAPANVRPGQAAPANVFTFSW